MDQATQEVLYQIIPAKTLETGKDIGAVDGIRTRDRKLGRLVS
jgi:hypothetical protein